MLVNRIVELASLHFPFGTLRYVTNINNFVGFSILIMDFELITKINESEAIQSNHSTIDESDVVFSAGFVILD